MSALDLSTYILASFTTVQEVKEALDPAHFTVVNFLLSQAAMDELLASGLMAAGGYPTIHLGIHDAMHNSLVIEFTGMPEHLQPLLAPTPKQLYVQIYPMPMNRSYTGDVIIIVPLPADKGHVLRDNPVGVLTNEPQLPQQYTQLQR